MPDMTVAIGNNYMAKIPGSGVTFAQVDANTCFGGIQSTGAIAGNAPSLQIYGDLLFRAQYVVFDGQNRQVQIGPKPGVGRVQKK